MRNVVLGACGLMLSVSGAASHAANWVMVGANRRGVAYFVDEKSIRTLGSHVDYWVKVDASANLSSTFAKALFRMNCRGPRR
jgi:hypothetical protein